MGPRDDTAGDDEWSTMILEPFRALRRPRGHRPNRWGRTDMAMVAPQMHADMSGSRTLRAAASRSCRFGRSGCSLAHQVCHALLELGERTFGGARACADQKETRWHFAAAKYRPQPSAKKIALHGRPRGATDCEGHLRWNHLGIGNERAPERVDPQPDTVPPEADESVAFADPVDQADRRVRPLARRDFSTARPARVLMRARKPCLRARRRLLG